MGKCTVAETTPPGDIEDNPFEGDEDHPSGGYEDLPLRGI